MTVHISPKPGKCASNWGSEEVLTGGGEKLFTMHRVEKDPPRALNGPPKPWRARPKPVAGQVSELQGRQPALLLTEEIPRPAQA